MIGHPYRRAASSAAWACSLAALAAALGLNFLAGRYVDRVAAGSPPSGDLLLARLPVVDTGALFVWGFAAFLGLAAAAAWRYERGREPWLLWCYAVLVTVRSGFILLTPYHAPKACVGVDSALFDCVGRYLTFRNDLFFSSHTALPFLGFLAYRTGWVRWSFMGLSLLLGAVVLLGRFHYSVDVAGAFFVTFAVYRTTRLWSPAFLRGASWS